ncbi:hypothetical protein NCC49_006251 [Naganishia albida]|nr:hypothetical protein NCC49_006251 [Naganishia albida]
MPSDDSLSLCDQTYEYGAHDASSDTDQSEDEYLDERRERRRRKLAHLQAYKRVAHRETLEEWISRRCNPRRGFFRLTLDDLLKEASDEIFRSLFLLLEDFRVPAKTVWTEYIRLKTQRRWWLWLTGTAGGDGPRTDGSCVRSRSSAGERGNAAAAGRTGRPDSSADGESDGDSSDEEEVRRRAFSSAGSSACSRDDRLSGRDGHESDDDDDDECAAVRASTDGGDPGFSMDDALRGFFIRKHHWSTCGFYFHDQASSGGSRVSS